MTCPKYLVPVAVYLLLLGSVTGGMFVVRSGVLNSSTVDSQADWDDWRAGVQTQQDQELGQAPSPVERRVPASSEPPGLVLMRDYFSVCLVSLLVVSTALYLFGWLFVSGIMTGTHRLQEAGDLSDQGDHPTQGKCGRGTPRAEDRAE